MPLVWIDQEQIWFYIKCDYASCGLEHDGTYTICIYNDQVFCFEDTGFWFASTSKKFYCGYCANASSAGPRRTPEQLAKWQRGKPFNFARACVIGAPTEAPTETMLPRPMTPPVFKAPPKAPAASASAASLATPACRGSEIEAKLNRIHEQLKAKLGSVELPRIEGKLQEIMAKFGGEGTQATIETMLNEIITKLETGALHATIALIEKNHSDITAKLESLEAKTKHIQQTDLEATLRDLERTNSIRHTDIMVKMDCMMEWLNTFNSEKASEAQLNNEVAEKRDEEIFKKLRSIVRVSTEGFSKVSGDVEANGERIEAVHKEIMEDLRAFKEKVKRAQREARPLSSSVDSIDITPSASHSVEISTHQTDPLEESPTTGTGSEERMEASWTFPV